MKLTNEQIKAKYPGTAERLIGERRVLRKLLTAIVEDGYHFRMNDGAEWSTPETQDVELAMGECMATDEDVVVVYKETSPCYFSRIGSFWLVYGNSAEEVISDHTDTSQMSRRFDQATIDG